MMKLTIRTWVTKDKTEQNVHYDPPPACIFSTVEKEAGQEEKANCRIIWCFYREGKRVATVLIDKGGGDIGWDEVNRLRNFWPKTITIRYSDEDKATSGTSCIPYGKASFCNMQETCSLTLDLEPAFCDEAFIHPDDDKAFYESIALTQADRDKIEAKDRELALKFEMTPAKGNVPPSARKKARNWSQREPYSINAQKVFATLWKACRKYYVKPPRARDFLDMYREKLAEMNIRTEDDIKRIRNQAKGNHLMGEWYERRAKKEKRR